MVKSFKTVISEISKEKLTDYTHLSTLDAVNHARQSGMAMAKHDWDTSKKHETKMLSRLSGGRKAVMRIKGHMVSQGKFKDYKGT